MFKPLTITFENQSASVNQFGGGLIAYTADDREILYSYAEDSKAGSMGDVLFPFPGRVEKGFYTFEGTEYQLQDVSTNGPHAIHGFAKRNMWQVEKHEQSSLTISFAMTREEYAARGFPFSLTLTITYSLDSNGLRVASTVRNTGSEKAPFGLGFHPYYRLGTEVVDEISLQIPAQSRVEFEDLKPTGSLTDIRQTTPNFSQLTAVGSAVIDNCFTDLQFENGTASTLVKSAHEQITIWQDESFPYLQLYSSDTLPETHFRRGLAIEPQTCTGFALNVPNMGLLILEPGSEWSGDWGINPF